MQVVKARKLEEAGVTALDLGINEGVLVSVNVAKKRALVKVDGSYMFVRLSDEAVKLAKSVVRRK